MIIILFVLVYLLSAYAVYLLTFKTLEAVGRKELAKTRFYSNIKFAGHFTKKLNRLDKARIFIPFLNTLMVFAFLILYYEESGQTYLEDSIKKIIKF